ncbi:MAG: hypothetical protein JRI36_09840 [Deltaproteobacteria bacterium]|nr:hypothetical protein [Deltaproteobacteria bacterium]
MPEKTMVAKKITMANTKQEMLKAYNSLLQQLQEKKEGELRPEETLEKKKKKEVVAIADSISAEGVATAIGNLRAEIGRMLTQISDRMEEQVGKFKSIQKAIEFKEKELEEVYEIERAAATLAALIESQNEKRKTFKAEMEAEKEQLEAEIETLRAQWDQEKREHEVRVKEQRTEEKKRREREQEEFAYNFEREQQLARDKFEDERAKSEREIALKKEQMGKELAERAQALSEKEKELEDLKRQVAGFPKNLELSVGKAVKDTAERLKAEAKTREELLTKEFDGERNVLTARIESLQDTVKKQGQQIAKLSEQLEMAYQKVQDIAVKAIEGSSNAKSFASLQRLLADHTRKPSQEK